MNLFKKHNQQNEAKAKDILENIVRMNVSKYMMAQKMVSNLLVAGEQPRKGKKGKKKEPCLTCKINEILRVMNEFEGTTAEATKSYKRLFGKEMDIDAIVEECGKKFYPLGAGGPAKKSDVKLENGAIMPDDTPEEIRDIVGLIQSKLARAGFKGTVEVVDMKGNNYGLKPEDFEDFPSYCRALSAAREAEASGKTGEEILTEAVIHNAEDHLEDQVAKEKLN